MERYCKCGCGQLLSNKKYKGRLRLFIHGHNGIGSGIGWRINHGYRQCTRAKNHWKYEQVIVMEQHIGRKLLKNEVVHHINGDKLDNRLENLQLLTRCEHINLHRDDLNKNNLIKK